MTQLVDCLTGSRDPERHFQLRKVILLNNRGQAVNLHLLMSTKPVMPTGSIKLVPALAGES